MHGLQIAGPVGRLPGGAEVIWTFTIQGPPVAWQRATPIPGRCVTPAKTRRHEGVVHQLAVAAGVRAGKGPCRVTVEAFFADLSAMDLDNVMKAVLDGLVGSKKIPAAQRTVLADDRWTVVREQVSRGALDAANPRTVVTVEALT